MSKVDVSDAFRNVRVGPDLAHLFCYTAGDWVVIDFELTCWPSGSPRSCGIAAAVAEHSHFNASLESSQSLSENRRKTEWRTLRLEGEPTSVPADANHSARTPAGGG